MEPPRVCQVMLYKTCCRANRLASRFSYCLFSHLFGEFPSLIFGDQHREATEGNQSCNYTDQHRLLEQEMSQELGAFTCHEDSNSTRVGKKQ
jgi:hypothetical protein